MLNKFFDLCEVFQDFVRRTVYDLISPPTFCYLLISRLFILSNKDVAVVGKLRDFQN